jgi:hypothetical protein
MELGPVKLTVDRNSISLILDRAFTAAFVRHLREKCIQFADGFIDGAVFLV